MKQNVLKDKSFLFAIRIVRLSRLLITEQREYVLSKQLLRCGTSVGAILREAEHAESIKDFVHNLSIGLKEVNECDYWLDLLFNTGLLEQKIYNSFKKDCEELLKLLISSLKTSKLKIKYFNL